MQNKSNSTQDNRQEKIRQFVLYILLATTFFLSIIFLSFHTLDHINHKNYQEYVDELKVSAVHAHEFAEIQDSIAQIAESLHATHEPAKRGRLKSTIIQLQSHAMRSKEQFIHNMENEDFEDAFEKLATLNQLYADQIQEYEENIKLKEQEVQDLKDRLAEWEHDDVLEAIGQTNKMTQAKAEQQSICESEMEFLRTMVKSNVQSLKFDVNRLKKVHQKFDAVISNRKNGKRQVGTIWKSMEQNLAKLGRNLDS